MKLSTKVVSIVTLSAGLSLLAMQPGDQVDAATQLGVVRVNAPANLRQGVGTDKGISRVLNTGERYKYFDVKEANGYTWYLVGRNEWVANAGASVEGANDAPTTPNTSGEVARNGIVTVTHSVRLRENAGLNARILRYLNTGERYKFFATKQADGYTWYLVGRNQWVADAGVTEGNVTPVAPAPQAQAPKTPAQNQAPQTQTPKAPATNNTTPAPAPSTATTGTVSAVINLAKQQLGKPYVWGAKGPNSFDCSGLMYYLFKNAAGRNIGGYTVPQETAGRQVSLANLQPGDILFWGDHGNTYHDALYIGNNQYIHAPQPGEVVKVATISPYFQPSFAVRVL